MLQRTSVFVLSFAAVFGGCAQSKQARSVDTSGFLGDYSMLREGESGEALLVFEKDGLDLSDYHSVIVDPVEVWMTEADAEDVATRNELAGALRAIVVETLKQDYGVVGDPGPGTLRLRLAITEAEGAPPVRNLLTTVVPIGRALSILKTVATGRGMSVGKASLEGELQDAVTGERLLAGADSRFGTKTVRGSIDKWSDAESAYEHWAGKILTRMRAASR